MLQFHLRRAPGCTVNALIRMGLAEVCPLPPPNIFAPHCPFAPRSPYQPSLRPPLHLATNGIATKREPADISGPRCVHAAREHEDTPPPNSPLAQNPPFT